MESMQNASQETQRPGVVTKNTQEIPAQEISFDLTSYVDPNGRVFEWEKQKRIFRAITKEKAPFFKQIVQQDFFQRLCADNLIVNTKISEYAFKDCGLLLEHEKIQLRSYCVEWPSAMLKDAALLTLDICRRLLSQGLTLQDAYPWNVYFKKARPIFIDIGSITKQDDRFIWKAYDQYCKFFLYPLYLCANNKGSIARALLTNYTEGITDKTFLRELPLTQKFFNPDTFFRITLPYALCVSLDKLRPAWKKEIIIKQQNNKNKTAVIDMGNARKKFLASLEKQTLSIKIDTGGTAWSGYYRDKFLLSAQEQKGLNEKTEVILKIIDACLPKTILDCGANTGRFSILAAKKGIPVVAWEKDEACLNRLYEEAKDSGLDITPLAVDFINPTPSFGWCSRQFPSAIQRQRSDMVFCLALIHHLVFKQWQNFQRIAEALSEFSHRWAVVEFIPTDDPFIKGCMEERFSFYTVDNLISALKKYFPKIEKFDSYPQGRIILLCTK